MEGCAFSLFEYQSKWIAGVLSGHLTLPSVEEMIEDCNSFYSKLDVSGIPKRYTHDLGDSQFVYNDWLAVQSGCPVSEEWRKQMYFATSKNRITRPETYRDVWEDDHLVSQAHQDFIQYSPNGLDYSAVEKLVSFKYFF